jgi:hypothetical protein
MKRLMFFALICILLFSCENDEDSVTGAVSETAGVIDTLFTDWGTFDNYKRLKI